MRRRALPTQTPATPGDSSKLGWLCLQSPHHIQSPARGCWSTGKGFISGLGLPARREALVSLSLWDSLFPLLQTPCKG